MWGWCEQAGGLLSGRSGLGGEGRWKRGMRIQVGEYRSEDCREVVCSSYVKGRSGFCRLNMAGWEVLRRFAYPELQPRPVISIAGLTIYGGILHRDVPPAGGSRTTTKYEISQFSHPSELHNQTDNQIPYQTPMLAKIIRATAINDRLPGIYVINLRNLIKTAQKLYNECSKNGQREVSNTCDCS